MKKDLLNNSKKLVLTINDIAKELSISNESAKVTANRYTKSSSLLRIKRNFYIITQRFKELKESELFQVANLIEVPSYISLTSALSYFNVTSQQLQNIVESISVKRSKVRTVKNIEFRYHKVKKTFYSGFYRSENFFIAEPEKAFADSVYMTAINRYSLDFEAVDFKKLNISKVTQYLESTNSITKDYWIKLCKRYKI